MMASPGPSDEFRLALVKSSMLLTEANVKALAFLCKEITPSRRDKITDGIELFTELESHNRLSEDDVTTLIKLMDDMQLGKAAQPLKEYGQYDETKEGDSYMKKCSTHQDVPLKFVCVSCDSQSCSECLLTTHKQAGCDVIRLDQLREEKVKRGEKLLEDIEEALSQINSAKGLLEKKKAEIMANPAKNKSDLIHLFEEMEHIQERKHQMEYLEKGRKDLSGNSLRELQRIWRESGEVTKIRKSIKEPMVHVLVGGVCLPGNAILNIYDNRRCDGGVLLVCIDPTDPGKEYLRHTVKVDDHQSPVVMSNIAMWYDGINHALFAVGKTVYIVRPHYVLLGPVPDYVESVTPLVIGEVPDGDYITSIAGCCKPLGEPEEELLISISGSSVLREYDITGSLLRSVETRDHVPSGGITGVAYNVDTVAVISSGSSEVMLMACGAASWFRSMAGPLYSWPVKRCGSLRPPTGLSPVIVIWTGICWLLLCTGSSHAGQCSVLHYDKTGELVKVCVEGASSSDLDVPVSISKWNRTGYVTLHNSTTRAFIW